MAEYFGYDSSDVAFVSEPSVREGVYSRHLKRTFDILVVLLASPFVLLLVLGFALAVRRDGGPAFYLQDRIGKNGRIFRIWKLRSMVTDADTRLAAHLEANPDARAEWDHHQKLKDDPRITKVGRLIRKTSLDELPQLWNVLTGDMSLVGPRPMMLNQAVLYPGSDYYDMRPGVTGLWQVSGRSDLPWDETVRLDVYYVDNWSVMQDLSILMRTAGAVLGSRGAY